MTRWMVLAITASLMAGCSSTAERTEDDEAMCKEPKAGVITTPNSYCVVEIEDTVDPAVAPVEWRGVKYGLCCEGCRPKWSKMTATQKDEGVAAAMAKNATP